MQPTDATHQLDVEPIVQVEGVVERIVYESPQTGFVVLRIHPVGGSDLVTAVGSLVALSPGETVRLRGRWVSDKKFGPQLRVVSYDTVLPATVNGIERYLGSGLISGVGPAYAKRLVNAFGVETLRVIDEHPERLRKVPGIGKKRATQIRDAWVKQKAVQSVMLFLQGHGIGVSQAVKIYQKYGDKSVAVLRENPYRLAEDIVGIGFGKADKIASQLGIAKDAPARLMAGALHVLDAAQQDGHVFLPEAELCAQAAELVGAGLEAIQGVMAELEARDRIVRENSAVYLAPLHAAEKGCAEALKRLISTPAETVSVRMEAAIAWVEKLHGVTLSTEQQDAIRTVVTAKVAIITGGPGTGKTTVINSFLSILEKKGVAFVLAAPTGRAAKRMEAATGRDALTIHRLLEYSPHSHGFARNEFNPLHTDLVVLDEASMIDLELMHSMLRALPPFARLVLVGDVDQLPSVGPGNVLLDLIASQILPVVRLKTVFRQAAQSGIIEGAHQINRGAYPPFNAADFFLIERDDPEKTVATILELVQKRMPAKFGLDPLRDIQVLSPMRRGIAGVNNLNEALQEAFNKEGVPAPRRGLRQGDKVMQLKNNYELDVYNGDVGIITLVDETAKELEVSFDDGRAVIYPFDDLDNLGLAYAATVHKSQGSEYPAVVLAFLPQHYMMLQRNVLYTAVTRGKRLVIIVGEPKAIGMAVRNGGTVRRNTGLMERLRNLPR